MRNFTRCPRCGAQTKPAIALNKGESEFWRECTSPKCNTFINTYIPQEHQEAVHKDHHKFIGNFGGYGSGKTLTSREEFYKHLFLTPNGRTLVGANVTSQYEATLKKDIESDIPIAFVKAISTQKGYIQFVNNHMLMFRPFDDPDKLRSYNLSMFIIMEASEVKRESFTQLKSRLRNLTASKAKVDENGNTVYRYTKTGVPVPELEAEWLKGIIESNPDSGWINTDVLSVSDDVQKHGSVPDVVRVFEDNKDPAISSHITVSDANEFLPPHFIEDLCKNKPAWWIARYVNGSFLYAEGLVYPSAMQHICEPFEVPRHWKRIMGFDYGLVDKNVYLFGAIDEKNNKLYIYKEVVTTNKNVEELAQLFYQASRDIPVGGWVCPPIIDPKSAPKRDYDKKSLADHFLDFGISFIPGHVDVDARIYRLNTYLESGKLLIMSNCKNLIQELKEYKFAQKRGDSMERGDKPEDKNNHSINALEWITMELPADPGKLVYGAYSSKGLLGETKQAPKQDYANWVLSDPVENTADTGAYDIIDYNF